MAVTLELLKRLNEHQVEFVLIGGLAANLHGVQKVTEDIDVSLLFTVENMQKVIAAVAGLNPHYRMRPDLPFVTDPQSYARFKNLYLVTDVGPIDFLGEVDGIGDYAEAEEFGDCGVGWEKISRAVHSSSHPSKARGWSAEGF